MNDLTEFRRAAHAAVDWVADYLEKIEHHRVFPNVRPGEIREMLPAHPPEGPEPFDGILADLDRVVIPGLAHWQSPMFFGYFPANASGPAIIGDLISSGLGVQGMMWATSPAVTEIETHVLDWMIDLMALPDAFRSTSRGGGVIQDSASSASLVALLAARERATGFASNRDGVKQTLTAYTSSQAHSSIEKAAGIAGIGRANLRLVDVDGTFAMRPEALERAIAADKAAGHTPCFVSATVGTTSSTAMDPVRAIGDICRRHGLWLHVDGAHAGSAAICPEFRWILDGLELADSYCFNPHKWLLTNFDCDCCYVTDRSALIRTLSILPEYLRNQATESGAVIDYRDWGISLGRRFRALKLWFVIRAYGAEGLRQHIRTGVALAQELAAWLEQDERFELVAPVPLNLVCFRLKAGDKATERLRDAINASGKMYLIHTKLDGKIVLRVAIGGTYMERRHVERAWQTIREMTQEISAGA
jgi:aromatic-L-amino-acid decarboxylase